MANLFLTGSGAPTSGIGEATDYYRDTVTNLIYYKDSPTNWVGVPSLIPTPDGVGTTWLYGSGEPDNGDGSPNDYYRNEDTAIVYRKDGANQWQPKGTLDFIGVYGVQWGNGLGAPANIAPLNNLPAGSFYLDVDTSDIYFKDDSLAWVLKGQLGNADAAAAAAADAAAAAAAASSAESFATQSENYYDSLIGSSLKAWAYAESFAVISATRNANNVITSANIKWPDGVSGVFTTDAIHETFNTIDAWHATYLDTVTKTVTQTTVTRNADGAVTAQPEITVSWGE